MANTTNFSVRMDSDVKKQCEALYGELGMNLTTAINVFLRQSLRSGGFPFDVTLNTPNAVTLAAMQEAKRLAKDPNAKRYSDVEEALEELKDKTGHRLDVSVQKRLQIGDEAQPENGFAGQHHPSAFQGAASIGEEPRPSFDRKLGGLPGMSYSKRLAACVSSREWRSGFNAGPYRIAQRFVW